ncbi:hypothetical protein RND81_04G066000 [Saponaria officinalis]|uniref:Uncharacterized protein n=1 Tax=Saponaria officinalis TaxID=3572 RepID=A0AAW1LID6_SAPOF
MGKQEANDADLYRRIMSFTWYIDAAGIGKDGKKTDSTFTGFSVEKGLIMTCAHGLVDMVQNLQIRARRLSEGDGELGFQYKVELGDRFRKVVLVDMAPERDLALLKLVEFDKTLAVAEFGDGELQVGQKVVHVGNSERVFHASYLTGNVAFRCTNDVILPTDDKKCCDYDITASDKTLGYRIFGHIYNRRYDWEAKAKDDDDDLTKNMHPLVPIIQINRMQGGRGCSGGPLCDTQGRVVGLMFRRETYLIAIHVSMLGEFLRRQFHNSDACR